MEAGGIILPDSAVQKQTLHFKDSENLVLLAKGDSACDGVALAHKMDCECWGLNDIERYPELTLLFELHDWDERCKDYNPVHLDTLPVMMKENYPDIPHAIKFPMEALMADFKIPYYNNQVCLMLAFAIHTRRFKNIYLFGVDYQSIDRVEQEFERPCTEFWLGMAAGRGCNLYISQQSNLMTYVGYTKGVIYGYTPDYQVPFTKFREAMPHYWSEYILGAYGGQAIGKGVANHDEWFEELGKFTTQYIHKKMLERQKLEQEDEQVST